MAQPQARGSVERGAARAAPSVLILQGKGRFRTLRKLTVSTLSS